MLSFPIQVCPCSNNSTHFCCSPLPVTTHHQQVTPTTINRVIYQEKSTEFVSSYSAQMSHSAQDTQCLLPKILHVSFQDSQHLILSKILTAQHTQYLILPNILNISLCPRYSTSHSIPRCVLFVLFQYSRFDDQVHCIVIYCTSDKRLI